MLRVISANRLQDGAVLYFGDGGQWVERLAQARAFESEAELEAALERAKVDERNNVVLDIYALDAKRSGGQLMATHIREAIRAAGPTVRPDLGKQASKPSVR